MNDEAHAASFTAVGNLNHVFISSSSGASL